MEQNLQHVNLALWLLQDKIAIVGDYLGVIFDEFPNISAVKIRTQITILAYSSKVLGNVRSLLNQV